MKILGRGNTAEAIEQDALRICKLFYEGYPIAAIEQECRNAELMWSLGLPVPRVHGMINTGNRTGIVYDRLYGRTMLDMLLEDMSNEALIKQMAGLHKRIISFRTDKPVYYKQFLHSCVGIRTELNAPLHNKIDKLPDGSCLCHGDYHPANIIIDDDGGLWIIDFINVCYGPWEYDVARTYFLIEEGEVPEAALHREEEALVKERLLGVYLKELGISYEDIAEYITVIKECRKYEI